MKKNTITCSSFPQLRFPAFLPEIVFRFYSPDVRLCLPSSTNKLIKVILGSSRIRTARSRTVMKYINPPRPTPTPFGSIWFTLWRKLPNFISMWWRRDCLFVRLYRCRWRRHYCRCRHKLSQRNECVGQSPINGLWFQELRTFPNEIDSRYFCLQVRLSSVQQILQPSNIRNGKGMKCTVRSNGPAYKCAIRCTMKKSLRCWVPCRN